MTTRRREGLLAFWLTLGAVVLSAAYFLAVWQLPLYATEVNGVRGSATTVETEGSWVLLLAAIPAAVALVTWVALHAKCSRGSRAGEVVAAVAVSGLGALAVISMASVGVLIVPIVGLLVAAVLLTPRAQRR